MRLHHELLKDAVWWLYEPLPERVYTYCREFRRSHIQILVAIKVDDKVDLSVSQQGNADGLGGTVAHVQPLT